jgi:uncharacterized protein (UPF0333 family)
MDFIERLLHISPDGGNGSLEFLIVTTVVVVILIAVVAAPPLSQNVSGIFGTARKTRRW